MGIRLSDKRLVYSLESVFEVASSPVSMFIWSLPVALVAGLILKLDKDKGKRKAGFIEYLHIHKQYTLQNASVQCYEA